MEQSEEKIRFTPNNLNISKTTMKQNTEPENYNSIYINYKIYP